MNRKAKLRRVNRTRKLVSARRRIRRYNLLASREYLEQLIKEMNETGLKAKIISQINWENIICAMILAKTAQMNIGDIYNETII